MAFRTVSESCRYNFHKSVKTSAAKTIPILSITLDFAIGHPETGNAKKDIIIKASAFPQKRLHHSKKPGILKNIRKHGKTVEDLEWGLEQVRTQNRKRAVLINPLL